MRSIIASLRTHGHGDRIVAAEVHRWAVGIDPTFMPKLFDRFRQVDTGNRRRHGGLGLGLSIASSLAALHRGQVRASSDGPGRGATFTISLPLAPPGVTAAANGASAAVALSDLSAALQSTRVIVVDDEADIRSAVSGMLERAGSTVLALESGAGIDAALASFHPPVLVLDIGMPGEDGYALIRRIRHRHADEGGTLPAISLTAHGQQSDREQALRSGFQAHLTKPVHFALLV